ncbi:MAG: RluA family pseudouridine synthase, partial [Betaproteobacteria bacterium]
MISGALDELGQDDAPDTGDDSEVRAWRVDASQHAQRLDKVLAGAIGEFSRNYLKQLIEQGAVERNGQAVVKVSTRLKAGDAMRVSLRPTPQSLAFKPEVMAMEVVHADADLLVLVKPAGLVVHPAPGNWSGTLLNGLLAWDPRQGELPRAGIVHRLDKDTSGLMLVARSRASMDALVR